MSTKTWIYIKEVLFADWECYDEKIFIFFVNNHMRDGN